MKGPAVRDIDPVSIRLFLATLEEGSIARAAARENIVPSAVSKRISLETLPVAVQAFVDHLRASAIAVD